MRILNTAEHYGLVTKLLHWATALLILGLVALGWYMVDLSYYDRWYHKSLESHKALGMLVFVLGVVTLLWRRVSASPGHAGLKRWERVAATAMHHTLSLLVFLIPVTGFLVSTSEGHGVSFFEWFEVPALVVIPERLREAAVDVHYYCGYGTALLVALHAAAALKHQFFDRDGTLTRMLWR